METKTFALETIADKENGVLVVKDYEENLKLVTEFLAVYSDIVITNDVEKKAFKEKRAELNKVVKAIDRKRIDTVADYVSDFEAQCKVFHDLFDNAQKAIGEKVKEYEDKQKVAIENAASITKYTATLKFTDESIIKKLQEFAVKNGCELTIK